VIKRLLGMPSVQIALCLAVFALVGWRFGKFAVVWTAPLLGAALCRPIMALVANIRHGARARVWLPVHGQHYVYKGVTIHVQQDEDRCRWVPLADVRKVVGTTASERTLAVAFPDRCKPLGKPAQSCLRDDALVEHLGRENNPAALRLRTWVERTIVLPGRKLRSNLGIRPEPPDA
jgi:hypothetical protein